MRHRQIALISVLGVLVSLSGWSRAQIAHEKGHFNTPAKAIAAAENAFGKKQFDAYVDCFSDEGQKQLDDFYVTMFLEAINSPPVTQPAKDAEQSPSADQIKALLAKYGVHDLRKQQGEDDQHLADRLAGEIKDHRAFAVDASLLEFPPASKLSAPVKGELQALKTDNASAHAVYAVHQGDSSMTQDIDFQKIEGSWKLAKFIFFVQPE